MESALWLWDAPAEEGLCRALGFRVPGIGFLAYLELMP